ncbi:competence type IV pilus minor pilin ComGD [Cytobacillus sp. FJAT-54145]|uniref:Competence type IV pilus minor pilin ComGD n=1 Tax=Cytobacillus spartinae TaxID=3299023 RepID=A0ABW6KEA5_9BACI
MLQRENGFTLIESLFVLSIFLIITTVSLVYLTPQNNQVEKQLFFSRLKADLLYAQAYAMSSKESVSVNILPQKHQYYIRRFNGELLVNRTYSKKIKIREGSISLYFKFNSDGNINSFGSFYIYFNEEQYRLTFLIGRGRFYVLKL